MKIKCINISILLVSLGCSIFSMQEDLKPNYRSNINASEYGINKISGWGNECLIRAFFESKFPNQGFGIEKDASEIRDKIANEIVNILEDVSNPKKTRVMEALYSYLHSEININLHANKLSYLFNLFSKNKKNHDCVQKLREQFNEIVRYNDTLIQINKINGNTQNIIPIINEVTTNWDALLKSEESVHFWKLFADLYLRKSLGYFEAPGTMGNILGIVFDGRVISYLQNGDFEEGPYGNLNGTDVKLLHRNYLGNDIATPNHYDIFVQRKNQRYINTELMFVSLLHLNRAKEWLPGGTTIYLKDVKAIRNKIKEYPQCEEQIFENLSFYIKTRNVGFSNSAISEVLALALSSSATQKIFSHLLHLNRAKEWLPRETTIYPRDVKAIRNEIKEHPHYEQQIFKDLSLYIEEANPSFDESAIPDVVVLALSSCSLNSYFVKLIGESYNVTKKEFRKALFSLDSEDFKYSLEKIIEKEFDDLSMVKGYSAFTDDEVDHILNKYHQDADFNRLVTTAVIDLQFETEYLQKILGACYHLPKDKSIRGAIARMSRNISEIDRPFQHVNSKRDETKMFNQIIEDPSYFCTNEDKEKIEDMMKLEVFENIYSLIDCLHEVLNKGLSIDKAIDEHFNQCEDDFSLNEDDSNSEKKSGFDALVINISKNNMTEQVIEKDSCSYADLFKYSEGLEEKGKRPISSDLLEKLENLNEWSMMPKKKRKNV